MIEKIFSAVKTAYIMETQKMKEDMHMATNYVICLKDEAQVKVLAHMAIGKHLWGGRLYKAVKFKRGNDSWWGFGFEGTILNYIHVKAICKGKATIFRV